MRVLLDENMPEVLADLLDGHECNHVVTLGWAGTRNGKLLLKATEIKFEVLITLDRQIQDQQNLDQLPISIVVLRPQGQGVKAVCGVSPSDQRGPRLNPT